MKRDDYFTVAQVVEMTGFSRSCIYRAIKRGDLKKFAPNEAQRNWWIPRRELERWIKACTG